MSYVRHISGNTVIGDGGIEFPRRGGNHTDSATIARVREMLEAGHGTRPIASELGISKVTVGRYRKLLVSEGKVLRCGCGAAAGHNGWCAVRLTASEARQEFLKRWARWKAPALVHTTSLERRIVLAYPYLGAGTINNSDLLSAINALVPHTLPQDVRADVCQEMIVDVLSGILPLAEAAAKMRKYITRAYGDRYRAISLDAPMRGFDDLRMIDTIESTRFHL